MTTEILKNLTKDGTHNVGSLNTIQAKTLANGAKVTGVALDNWVLVELAGFDEEGVRLCKALSDKTKSAYLVATPEQRFLGEDIAHFFNDVDEMVRPVLLESHYTRFEASNYTLNEGGVDNGTKVTEVENGQVAHFDVATQKYIISDVASPHADFATSAFQFEVVADLNDTAGNFLQPTVRFMCIKTGY